MKVMRSILIGYGYWGRIVERYLQQSEEFLLLGIFDPHLENSLDLDMFLEKKDIDCAFICTPLATHYAIVQDMLGRGLHIFCEKPLCHCLKQTAALYQTAHRKNRVLFTDYIYTVSPSVQFIKQQLGRLGEIRYINMDIRQFGRFYKSDSVYEVLGVHMISVLAYVFDTKEGEIKVTLADTMTYGSQNQAESGCILFRLRQMRGKIVCSLVSDEKTRKMEFLCDNGAIIFNMLAQDTVKVIQYQEDDTNTGQKKRDVLDCRQFDEANNLRLVCKCFYQSIDSGDRENEKISIQVADVLEQIRQYQA